MTSRESNKAIDRAAAGWATRLDGAARSPSEDPAFETWIAADPRHRGALARAMAVLAYFDSAKALGAQASASRGLKTICGTWKATRPRRRR